MSAGVKARVVVMQLDGCFGGLERRLVVVNSSAHSKSR
jgi:hypothetical protein